MRYLPLLGALLHLACARGPLASPAPPMQNTPIIFPKFLQEESISLDQPGKNFNLDGASLQALLVAANDFFPPVSPQEPCWSKPSAHRLYITRRDDIIFVEIYAAIFACDWKSGMISAGARYAISTDGRILRRLAEGEPDGSPPAPEPLDGGTPDKRDYSSMLGYTFPELPTVRLPGRREAGAAQDAGTVQDAGPGLDGGSQFKP